MFVEKIFSHFSLQILSVELFLKFLSSLFIMVRSHGREERISLHTEMKSEWTNQIEES